MEVVRRLTDASDEFWKLFHFGSREKEVTHASKYQIVKIRQADALIGVVELSLCVIQALKRYRAVLGFFDAVEGSAAGHTADGNLS